ncbi:hypothetical protein [Thalassospira alkalitolerans]|nr:hypothetical protein [Thalassospira alkalitolerans]|tara:strand:+ start:106206 stop:106340 length:135 start_codon:yes stop_codon:yes gene_type:complete
MAIGFVSSLSFLRGSGIGGSDGSGGCILMGLWLVVVLRRGLFAL